MLLSDVCLSDVCLTSVAYIGRNSRTEGPRKTKIGTEVAQVTPTRDSDTTFKVKRSKVKFTRPLYSCGVNASGSCSGDRGNVWAVGNYCYVAVCTLCRPVGSAAQGASATTERGEGGGILLRPPTYRSQVTTSVVCVIDAKISTFCCLAVIKLKSTFL